MDCFKRSKPELWNLHKKKKRDITDFFRKTEYKYKKCEPVKKLKKELE